MATLVEKLPAPFRQDENGVRKIGNSPVSVLYACNNGYDATEIQHSFDPISRAHIHAVIAY